jgi:hypothetical protein
MNFFRIFPIVVIGLGTLLMSYAAKEYIQTKEQLSKMQEATGIVTSNYETETKMRLNRKTRKKFIPIIEYMIDGKKYNAKSNLAAFGTAFYKEGDRVDILYDINRPSKILENHFFGLWLVPSILLVGSLVIIIVGVILRNTLANATLGD